VGFSGHAFGPVVDAVGRVHVLLDQWLRSGLDVLEAVALGCVRRTGRKTVVCGPLAVGKLWVRLELLTQEFRTRCCCCGSRTFGGSV